MRQRYYSRRDWAYTGIIWLVVALMLGSLTIVPGGSQLTGALTVLLVTAFLLWIFFNTYYEFHEAYLYVRSGPFVERIAYDSIIEIKKATNFYSSKALAIDRVMIRTDRKWLAGLTYISPENRDDFIHELSRRCNRLRT